LASAHVWTIEHQKTLQLNQELSNLTLPVFAGHIHLQGFAPAGIGNQDTLLLVVIDIENTGAPSIAKNVRAGVDVGGKMYWGREVIPTPETTFDSPQGDVLTFMKADWLLLKANSQPIPNGGSVQGFEESLITRLDRNSLSPIMDSVVVSFQDIHGKEYQIHDLVGNPQKLLTPEHLQPEYKH
jgi:hypothetical protein